ncbi:MAG: hypothetical protein NTW86_28560 [Candidatus Sumerlaeota bacterium]|nr:hypothetical protein [Candidatus Sumerlaeota bacterium]
MSKWSESRSRWAARANRWLGDFVSYYSEAAWAEAEERNWMIPYETCPWEFPFGQPEEETFEDRVRRMTAAGAREEAYQRARAQWDAVPSWGPKSAAKAPGETREETREESREAWRDRKAA